MKRIFTLALFVLFLASVFKQKAFASSQFIVDGVTYETSWDNTTVRATKLSSSATTKVAIPASVSDGSNTYPVIEISTDATWNNVLQLSIPATITKILYAYSYLKSLIILDISDLEAFCKIPNPVVNENTKIRLNGATLTDLTIPESIQSIGSCFYQYTFLKSVTFHENFKIIGNTSFAWCKSLSSVYLPANLESIRAGAFEYTENLKSIVIPGNITEFGTSVFHNSRVESVEIEEGLTTIPERTFSFCESLTDVTLPKSIKTIDKSAFLWCSALTTIDIPSEVSVLGEECFSNCRKLQSIRLPESLELLSKNAFEYCTSLTHINLPNSMLVVNDYCFANCSSLEFISFGSEIMKIGYSFRNCPKIKDIYVNAIDVPVLNESAFDYDVFATAVVHVPEGTRQEYAQSSGWSKFANIQETAGITPVINPEVEITSYYTLEGLEVKNPQKPGIYIVRYSDGTTRKQVVNCFD